LLVAHLLPEVELEQLPLLSVALSKLLQLYALLLKSGILLLLSVARVNVPISLFDVELVLLLELACVVARPQLLDHF